MYVTFEIAVANSSQRAYVMHWVSSLASVVSHLRVIAIAHKE